MAKQGKDKAVGSDGHIIACLLYTSKMCIRDSIGGEAGFMGKKNNACCGALIGLRHDYLHRSIYHRKCLMK